MHALLALAAAAAVANYGPASSGHTIKLKAGSRATISLPSNPGTGYHWVVVTKPNARVAKLVSSRFVNPPQTTPPTVGATGKQVYTLRGVAAGTTRFRANYVSPGRNQTVGKRYSVRIEV